jgi:hypothetical protein
VSSGKQHQKDDLQYCLAEGASRDGTVDQEPDAGEHQGDNQPNGGFAVRPPDAVRRTLPNPLLQLLCAAAEYLDDVIDTAVDAAGQIAGLEARKD